MNNNTNGNSQVSVLTISEGIARLKDEFVKSLDRCNSEVEGTYNRMISSGALSSEELNPITNQIISKFNQLKEEFVQYADNLASNMQESESEISAAQRTIANTMNSTVGGK